MSMSGQIEDLQAEVKRLTDERERYARVNSRLIETLKGLREDYEKLQQDNFELCAAYQARIKEQGEEITRLKNENIEAGKMVRQAIAEIGKQIAEMHG